MSDDISPLDLRREAKRSAAIHPALPVSSLEQGLMIADRMISQGLALKELSAKQECFAIAMAEGSNASEAYRYAYGVTDIPSQIYAKAREVVKRPHIAARIRALRLAGEAKLLRDKDKTQRYVIDNLQRIIELPGTHHSARVHALAMLGKLSGLFEGGNNGANASADKASAADIERELSARLGVLLGDKAKAINGLAVVEHDVTRVNANNPRDNGEDSAPILADEVGLTGGGG